jgi:hypothetical protein
MKDVPTYTKLLPQTSSGFQGPLREAESVNKKHLLAKSGKEQNLHTLQHREAVESDQITLGVAFFSSCMVYENDAR